MEELFTGEKTTLNGFNSKGIKVPCTLIIPNACNCLEITWLVTHYASNSASWAFLYVEGREIEINVFEVMEPIMARSFVQSSFIVNFLGGLDALQPPFSSSERRKVALPANVT